MLHQSRPQVHNSHVPAVSRMPRRSSRAACSAIFAAGVCLSTAPKFGSGGILAFNWWPTCRQSEPLKVAGSQGLYAVGANLNVAPLLSLSSLLLALRTSPLPPDRLTEIDRPWCRLFHKGVVRVVHCKTSSAREHYAGLDARVPVPVPGLEFSIYFFPVTVREVPGAVCGRRCLGPMRTFAMCLRCDLYL